MTWHQEPIEKVSIKYNGNRTNEREKKSNFNPWQTMRTQILDEIVKREEDVATFHLNLG